MHGNVCLHFFSLLCNHNNNIIIVSSLVIVKITLLIPYDDQRYIRDDEIYSYSYGSFK